jgi:beta-xylosidase
MSTTGIDQTQTGSRMLTDKDGKHVADARRPLVTADREAWRDPTRPVEDRVADLLSRMTLPEKVGQLYAVWLGAEPPVDGADGDVAPFQHELIDGPLDWPRLIGSGLGQLTRPFGTAPVDPAAGARTLAFMQSEIVAAGRFGIPAVVHEECLTGVLAHGATIYPTPLAWGATFDPALIEEMAAQIGETMRSLGVHQGLAPVLDVTRDPRWGRTEETIGEDPYLAGTVGTAYVRGLQSAGILATLKHFAGYSASRAARNFGPVAVGRRDLADVILPPFEMAVREGAGSVMASYAEIDGVPTHADDEILTDLLRGEWGFTGTVVGDYFGVAFLERLHHVAGTEAEAAALALAGGVDVELPNVRCYGEPLLAALRAGAIPEALVDRAAARVLRQKFALGLLDPEWSATRAAPDGAAARDGASARDGAGRIDLDPPDARALARRVADESVVLLHNDGTLPLRADASIAVVGPLADDAYAMLGCYTFPSHVGRRHPELPMGVEIGTLLDGLSQELPGARIAHAPGCTVDGPDESGFAAAVEAATAADVCVVALGDRAGLFGHGTSGEGCDAEDLRLPGIQGELLDAVLATGPPVVLVVLSGRPYALGAYADRLAATVQTFFPGEEGGPALAGVLSGRVCPSGRLPVGIPHGPGGQPATYLAPALGQRTDVSTVDPTPLYPFGHGLSYSEFAWEDVRVDGRAVSADPVECPVDGAVTLSLSVRNTGGRAGAEVVQLYLHDPVAQVTRPVVRLIGYARVELAPGEARRVEFTVPADLSSFIGRKGQRVVEPGELELRLAASCQDVRLAAWVRLTGKERMVDHRRELTAGVTVR